MTNLQTVSGQNKPQKCVCSNLCNQVHIGNDFFLLSVSHPASSSDRSARHADKTQGRQNKTCQVQQQQPGFAEFLQRLHASAVGNWKVACLSEKRTLLTAKYWHNTETQVCVCVCVFIFSWKNIQVCAACLHKHSDNSFLSRGPLTVVIWLALLGLLAEEYCYWCNLLCACWSQVCFYIRYIKPKRWEEDTQGYTNTKLHSRREEIKRETRLLCHWVSSEQIILTLFMLDLDSAPPPPVSSIKHSFISLHPFVQFGHIILCSGMSSIVIYELSEWTHLIYSVCRYMEIQKGGKQNVIRRLWQLPFVFGQ